MGRNILFCINPVSGTKSKKRLEDIIFSRCEQENIHCTILPTSAEGDYHFLKDKISNEGITDVVICGGDGSLSPIISHLLHTDVNIGILPLGSGNGLARTAGISPSLDKALDTIFYGTAHYVDAILINGHLSCQLSGLGFDAQVAEDFSKHKQRGLNTYIKEVFKNLFTTKTWPFEITIDGKVLNEDAFCVCIANSNQFGNNFTIAPKASLSDGLLDVVVLKKTSKPLVIYEVMKQVLTGEILNVRARDLENRKVLYFQTNKLYIKNKGNAPLHIDGDPKPTAADFQIETIPSAYRLLQ